MGENLEAAGAGLGHAQHGQIQSAAVIEVELRVLRNDCVSVGRGPEIET